MIECILFDMGNTLIDFEPEPFESLHRTALRRVHDAIELSEDPESFIDAFGAVWRELEAEHRPDRRQPHLGDAFERVLTRLGAESTEETVSRMEDAHFGLFRERIRLYPEVPEVLRACRARGLKLGLVSNTIWRSDDHRRDLERFGIADAFDHQVFSRDFGWMKPHPSIFHQALSALDTPAGSAMMIGDRLSVDIAGGRAVGCRTVLRRHPHTYEATGRSCEPDLEIDDLVGLLDVVDRLS